MTTPSDVVSVQEPAVPQEPAVFPSAADAAAARRESAAGALNLAQEINERRARVENAELLQELRAL
jgi:hypothetical protein